MEKKIESIETISTQEGINNNLALLEEEYFNQLNVQEKKAFLIAKNHLGSSFHIGKSNGYNEWFKKK